MSIKDVLNANKLKEENKRLNKIIEETGALLVFDAITALEKIKSEKIEMQETYENILAHKANAEAALLRINRKLEEKEKLLGKYEELEALKKEIQNKKQTLLVVDENVLMESFGLYSPKYSFCSSKEYKERLDEIRTVQKQMIKDKSSVSFFKDWTVDGSKAKGKKFTNDNIKQLLRSFNCECENAIEKVKFNNYERMEKRIKTSFETLNKLNEMNRVAIRPSFLNLKLQELSLAHEYQLKLQEEKEERRLLREQEREEARIQKEIEESRKLLNKEQRHYEQALEQAIQQLDKGNPEEKDDLLIKIENLKAKNDDLLRQKEDLDYRLNNQRAGYVYIISNIGSFGENVYKIGMTRRLDPMERVRELGDASVPFNFDVHAMIFSKDAPALEATLHRAFENRKINLVNNRREFFKVPLEDIKQIVYDSCDKTIEFIDVPPAEHFRESMLIRKQKSI